MARRVSGKGTVSIKRVHLDRTIGIDVDSEQLVTAFLNAGSNGNPTCYVDEFPNTPRGMRALVERARTFESELIVLESTGGYSISAYDALANAQLPVLMVNPLHVKALLRVQGKTDQQDAATLARLAASFELRGSNIPTPEMREIRAHWRIYDEARQERIRQSNRLGSALRKCACSLMSVSSGAVRWDMVEALGKMPREAVAQIHPMRRMRNRIVESIPEELPDWVLHYRDQQMPIIRAALARQDSEHRWLKAKTEENKVLEAMRWMLTVPYTTPLVALRCIGEMGFDFTRRFGNVSRFCAAMGVAPKHEVTGGKLTKVSRTHGRKALIVHLTSRLKGCIIRMPPTRLTHWYNSYKGRAGYSKALLALAHEIAKGWYVCTRKEESWDDRKFGRRGDVDPETGEILNGARS